MTDFFVARRQTVEVFQLRPKHLGGPQADYPAWMNVVGVGSCAGDEYFVHGQSGHVGDYVVRYRDGTLRVLKPYELDRLFIKRRTKLSELPHAAGKPAP